MKSGASFSGSARRIASGVSQTGLWIAVVFLLLLGTTALTLAIVTFIRTNDRHKGLSSRIHEARDASNPVGFSVYKNATQDIPDVTPTNLIEWAYANGSPAYDASAGAFDPQTGVFTTSIAAYYMATGTVCFNSTSPNGTLEVHLMTNASVPATVFNRQEADPAIDGDQCLGVHQNMWLPVLSEVWLMVLTGTGNTEMVSMESRFGVERIAM